MYNFLYNNYIIYDLLVGHKSSLIFRYDYWKHFLDSICNYFCFDLIGGITKRDGAKSIEIGGIGFFWD